MASLHETAYPRFKPNLTDHELREIYTPTNEEIDFCKANAQQMAGRLSVLILLKTVQRLGYFVKLIDVPQSIVTFLSDCSGFKLPKHSKLRETDSSGTRTRFVARIRTYLDMQSNRKLIAEVVDQTANTAAQTKQELADIINVVIEELVRQRYELPGFTVLLRASRRARTGVNNRHYQALAEALTPPEKERLDAMLVADHKQGSSDWQRLKREPRKPTNKEVRQYLKHTEWLKSWIGRLPAVRDIPAAKLRQFVLEARALDIADMRRLKPSKRYFLLVVLVHAQLRTVMDDAVEIFHRKIKSLHNTAEVKLEQYHLQQVKRTEKLIGLFRDVLGAYQDEDTDPERIAAMIAALHGDPSDVIAECEEHLAYAGNNYYPFMLSSYQPMRPLLLNCLELLEVQSSTNDRSVIDAVGFIISHRHSHKETIPLGEQVEEINLSWVPDKWRKLVLGKAKGTPTRINRKYFELCTLTQVMKELKSCDLYVEHSDQYGDYRDQLVDWKTYEEQVPAFCQMMGISREPAVFVANLKSWLTETAREVDAQFPTNEYLDITDDGFVLKQHSKHPKPAALAKIDTLISQRLPPTNILDILAETESWLDLHRHFGPLSGYDSKIDDPRKRFITTLFCYGCNLGPSQTARSVKDLSRKQVAWLNLHHVSEERLDKATVEVINAYNKYRLPRYWGTGKRVSADGTKWNMYEQNLLSEYHIRYGGYGGIGYYHVSDKYIALFSHFIPCGVYEAIYILDGLLDNESEIQPDTIHGDTQAQSTPVFGLAHLLGINLMPRIRNIKDLTFFKTDKETHFKHIEKLFSGTINWDIIETHLPDMLRIALSIKAGKLTPSAILRRLGTYSRKNKIYFAFRELGRVVRTEFLLNYIADVDLRKTIHASTNKSEEFNKFVKWLFFGGEGIIAQNVRHEQRKIIKYNHLVANMVILHNVEAMTRVLSELIDEGYPIDEDILAGFAPYRTESINRFGDYILDLNRKFRPMSYEAILLE